MLPFASRRPAVVAGIGLLVAVFACDKGPTSPSIPRVTPTVGVARVELQAPGDIAPGESIQLTLNAVLSNGSVENVTNRATWTLAGSQTFQLTTGGLLTAKTRGEDVISAHYTGLSASARILALPKGTFRLSGTISERNIPLPGVTVTVIAGEGEGLTTTSDSNGNYKLYGVAGAISLRLRREG